MRRQANECRHYAISMPKNVPDALVFIFCTQPAAGDASLTVVPAPINSTIDAVLDEPSLEKVIDFALKIILVSVENVLETPDFASSVQPSAGLTRPMPPKYILSPTVVDSVVSTYHALYASVVAALTPLSGIVSKMPSLVPSFWI